MIILCNFYKLASWCCTFGTFGGILFPAHSFEVRLENTYFGCFFSAGSEVNKLISNWAFEFFVELDIIWWRYPIPELNFSEETFFGKEALPYCDCGRTFYWFFLMPSRINGCFEAGLVPLICLEPPWDGYRAYDLRSDFGRCLITGWSKIDYFGSSNAPCVMGFPGI